MSKRRFLVTAALPYSNGRLHVGHIAGAYLPADIYVRYLRSRGDEVRFICGSDDNGVAIEISARQENTTPAELSAKYNAQQNADFEGLGNKVGVGFSFWLEEEATMLKIDYTITGWEGEVQRISSSQLPIAVAQLGNKQQVSWTEPLTSGRIWFTRLAPVPDSDRYGVFINEVTFYR